MQDLDADELIAAWTAARAEIAEHEIGTEEHERALLRAIACSEEYRRRLVSRRSQNGGGAAAAERAPRSASGPADAMGSTSGA